MRQVIYKDRRERGKSPAAMPLAKTKGHAEKTKEALKKKEVFNGLPRAGVIQPGVPFSFVPDYFVKWLNDPALGDCNPEGLNQSPAAMPLAKTKGHAAAQSQLGSMYQHGFGVDQDATKAVEWFRRAAEQGNPRAQKNLGRMYEFGDGVFQNNVMAHMWYNIASANGSHKAGKLRDKIAKLMKSSDILRARSMAVECISRPNLSVQELSINPTHVK